MATQNEDRLFVKNGLRHYRRTYSLTEVRVGVLILLGLAAIAAWVAWRGGQADPELFSAAPGQIQRAIVVGEGQAARSSPSTGSPSGRPSARGTAPEGLAPPGWKERDLSTFGPEDVYEKINGREGYYKSFGFESLTFVALELESDSSVSVDIEIYDQGKTENALGAFAGELPAEAAPESTESGLVHRGRNALFLTRGRHYVRVVGSEESEVIKTALDHLRERLEAGLAGEPLPWAFALFTGALRVPPGRVSYSAEATFSFEGFDQVWVGLLSDEETELFVSRDENEAAARAKLAIVSRGFLSYGEPTAGGSGLQWVKDHHLGRFSTAKVKGTTVLGVRGADSVQAGEGELRRLELALD